MFIVFFSLATSHSLVLVIQYILLQSIVFNKVFVFVHICIFNRRFFLYFKVPQQDHEEELFKSSPNIFCCKSVAVSYHARFCQTFYISAVINVIAKRVNKFQFI